MIRVLFATSEVYPLVKTGGLADVSASLPEALCKLGYDVHILLPGYPAAVKAARDAGSRRKTRFRIGQYEVSLWQTRLPGTAVTLWLVDCPPLFDRPGNPYQNENGQDWWDNAHRFELFGRVGAMMAVGEAGVNWRPDLVHCNDWQTGLIPVFLEHYSHRPGTVFTIHNLAYQGIFSHETFRALGLPDSLWRWDQLEFYGQLSFIKGGLVFSDRITTVSPEYAREIQSTEFGHGLDGVLRHRAHRLTGILNGIDTRVWNPEEDPELAFHYGRDHLKNKTQCQAQLQQELGLEVNGGPLLGFIGRLVEQKGVDWLIAVMPELLDRGCQFVVLGSGEARYEEPLKQIARQWPRQMSLTLGYDEGLSHRITAGCDIFLMPSRFEPCGLNQMYSLRYGTIPVVHAVGGLSDTVNDPLEAGIGKANGFRFIKADEQALLATINRALENFRNRKSWRRLQENGMAADYSWKQRARSYGNLYQSILKERDI
ncbi:glycogen synthase GlgA [Marinobacter panjinensis]|uniref:Glycogen synthase n=1 Tax=Marinobacter panjinensis TaxID=2576384 RepID=A0A4U6R0Z1_9GAMM|nr:glycogen synthase GlgA [Marinobacter panjinensis]MCR8916004.1 glycogen synthase GlgA [Marinobacter panjinensis]TKV67029.1 glycogen synthase GlgA [Marinobacter panjinensis]